MKPSMTKIRKTLMTLVGLLAFCFAGHSQTGSQYKVHEISVGVSPVPFWASVMTDWEWNDDKGIIGNVYGEKHGKARKVPMISVAYNHYLKKWLSLNTRLSYSGQYSYIYSGADSKRDRLDVSASLTLIEMVNFTYLNKENVRLYSSVGLGLSAYSGTLLPAIQLSYFGVSFGKKFFGFAELGGGTEYFAVHGGLGYRF